MATRAYELKAGDVMVVDTKELTITKIEKAVSGGLLFITTSDNQTRMFEKTEKVSRA